MNADSKEFNGRQLSKVEAKEKFIFYGWHWLALIGIGQITPSRFGRVMVAAMMKLFCPRFHFALLPFLSSVLVIA